MTNSLLYKQADSIQVSRLGLKNAIKTKQTGRGEREEKQAELSNEVPRSFYLSIVERGIRREEEARQRRYRYWTIDDNLLGPCS